MSRDELNATAREELAALDRIIAREPVEERHLELAALVVSVRASVPRMDAAFAERLETRLGAHHRARGASARPALRRLALAGGGLVAAAVAFTIVISSGALNSARVPAPASRPGATALEPRALSPGRSSAAHSAPAATSAPATPAAGSGAASATTTPLPSPPTTNLRAVAPRSRLVHKNSTLTLATSPASMQGVANQIVAATEHAGGVVESSNVSIQGSASLATFSLQVPSARLSPLIATLSALASVRSLNQGTLDITDSYSAEQARLATNLSRAAALRTQIAAAPTLTLAASLKQRLTALEDRIAAERRNLARLLTSARVAALAVTVVPGGAARHSSAGPFATAFDRGRRALEAILAIALVAFAIVLPFALTALALWWGVSVVRQRARERAMRTA